MDKGLLAGSREWERRCLSEVTPAPGDSRVSLSLAFKRGRANRKHFGVQASAVEEAACHFGKALDGDLEIPGLARKKLALWILGDSPFALSTCKIRP